MLRPKTKIQFLQKETLLIVGLFFLAFVIRLIYLNQISSSPYFDTPQIDALWHHNWAKEIAGGNWTGEEAFFRAPLYPYFLGILYALFGESFYLPRLIQIIIGSLNCVLIFLLGKKLFNRKIGIIASFIACLYAPLIYFDAELLIPVLIIFLDLMLILLLLSAEVRLKKRWWLAAGIVLGLSAIARPNILIFVPFVLLWICIKLWKENKNKIIFSSLFFLLGTILIIAPVTIRNWVVGKDFVLISSQGGINFFIGNNIESDGKTAAAATGMFPYEGYKDNIWLTSIKLAEKNLGRKLKPSEISNFWFKQALDFIKTYPSKYLQLLGKKLYFFWNSYEIESSKDLYFHSRWSSLLRLFLWDHLLRFPFGLICPLALLGIILNAKFWKKYFLIYAFILSYMFSVILFFVTSRFRLPVIPLLIIFASFSLYWLVEKIRNKQTRPFFVSLTILIPLFLMVNSNLFGVNKPNLSATYNTLGIVYAQKGWYDSAISVYQKSIEANPTSPLPHLHLGNVYYKKGYWDEAIKEYEQAIDLDPHMAKAHNHLGYVYDRRDRDEEAFKAYKRALEIDSTMVRAYINLAFLFEKKKLYEDAVNEYQKALRFEPEVASIHNNLGNAYTKLDLKNKAVAEFKEALRLDPNYVYAHLNLGNVYFEKDEYQMAITQYSTALKLDPKMIKAYRNLAITYLKTNQPHKAIEVLKHGLKTNPDAGELKKLLKNFSAES
ncbi:MAG: tetratricopeptide repeat protein [candidate division Zixibacteria bacterium]|nr:tetratricopeptide repeat protein [candidate division Zixibacteria bacterium]